MPCIPLHKFGRWTYFGWTQWQRFESSTIHCFWDTCQHFLKTHFCLESGFLSFLVPEERWLAYHYTKRGRWTYFGWTQWQRFESSSTHHFWDTPQHFLKTYLRLESGFLSFVVPEQRWLTYHYSKLGRWTYFGWWTPPWYQIRDALHTTTQIWQMNLLWLNTMAKVWKL